MWSVGCILAELLWRKPLFRGRNFADQLKVGVLRTGVVTTNSLAYVLLSLSATTSTANYYCVGYSNPRRR